MARSGSGSGLQIQNLFYLHDIYLFIYVIVYLFIFSALPVGHSVFTCTAC